MRGQRKVSFHLNIKFKSFPLMFQFLFSAAATLPAPAVLFSSALFAVGDLLRSIPDTTPGVASCHSVAITGASKEPFVIYIYIIDPSPHIHLTYIFNLALCEATLLKYSVAWQRVKEATHRPNLFFFFFIPHFIRILFLFFLAFLIFSLHFPYFFFFPSSF